jgi:hypothetical protein
MLGATHLTPSVIANIETGRRDELGRRRREVTVDELLVFAYALAAPLPVLLLPLTSADRVNVTPNVPVSTEAALRWALSETPPPTPDGRVQDAEVWAMQGAPLWRYQELWKLLEASNSYRALIEKLADEEALQGSDAERAERLTRLREALDRELREISVQLTLMEEQGVVRPALSPRLMAELERIGHGTADFRAPR